MKICVTQIKPEKGNIRRNIDNHKYWIEFAVVEKANFIFFPELSLTGYEPELAKELATDQSDSRLDDFQKISDRDKITIGVGLPTKSKSGILISMIIFQPNRPRQTYSKQKLHSDEKPYFVEGKEQIILEVENKKISLAICYESLQPEHSENSNKLGAEFYFASVAKSKSGIEKAFAHFPKIAKKNSMPVFMSNCIGFCDNFESVGQTSIWNEIGILIGQLDMQNEGILIYDTKFKTIKLKQKTICYQ